MAMGKRKSERAPMWVATTDLPVSPGHPFYARLNAILDEHVRARADAGRQLSEAGVRRNGAASYDRPKLGEILDIGACLSQRCRSQQARSFNPGQRGYQAMDRERLRKVRALRFGLLLSILLLVAAPAVAQTPTPGKPKVDRLVMGLITPYLDYVRPWINGTADHNIQHDPMLEWLVEVDAETGQYKPGLADSWTLGPNGRSWRVKLHKGVQFHHGYGEFTAQDVVHTHALWCDPNYPGRKDPPVSGYRAGICQVQKIEVVSAHEITMHCKVVCLDMPFYYSSASNVMIFSKKQWDAEGEMGYDKKPAGTGPYIYKERQLGRYVLYERGPTPHWKQGVVDWKEIKMTWTIEEATRLAQLIAGETHLTEVNKDLTDELVGKGYKLIRSRGTAQQMQINFGGLYFGTEDKATGRYTEYGGTTGKLDPKLPWTNVKVRQAMNKAINRKELLKVLYKGRASPMYVHGFYPGLEGWDPSWEKRFPGMYGYDPAAAKRLLAEAGYPNGFKARAWLYPFAGAPEMVAVMEAVALQLREVGIEIELVEGRLGCRCAPQVAEARGQWLSVGGPTLQEGGR